MRPDIDAGPIARKCSDSNGLVPVTALPAADWPRPTRDWAPKAAASAPMRRKTRAGFICVSSGYVGRRDYTNSVLAEDPPDLVHVAGPGEGEHQQDARFLGTE